LKQKGIPKIAWQGFLSMTTPSAVDKWMAMSPGTPKAHVEAYRKAYKASASDPEFLKVARKQFSKEIFYISGTDVTAMVEEIHNAPAAAVDYAEGLKRKYGLAAFKKKKRKKDKKKEN
jgi:tripartite-type tricarboxylate transporter receptor subunit TctC